jgi:hypothetical protein
VPATATILDAIEIASPDPSRVGKKDLVVTYQTDPANKYVVRVPVEAADGPALADAIKQDVARRAALIGKSIPL